MQVIVEHFPAFRFKAVNETGNEVHMDASPAIGGEETGMRPMEMLLAGLGGCSGIDVVNILKKKKQEFGSFKMHVNAVRDPREVPSLFKTIQVDFYFEGERINTDKVMQAVDLSIGKYCSVAKTLEKTAAITYSIFVNGKAITERKTAADTISL
ncbi:MAG TPA: OsmC family protein [Flavobacteriales bacterium]|nr:OsmC family protein [Flavobacteriales bacterium]